MSQQSAKHASVLAKLVAVGTGEGNPAKYKDYSYEAAFHRYWDSLAVPAGYFNERMVAWINAALVTSYPSIVTAQQAYAVAKGVANWDSLGDLGLP